MRRTLGDALFAALGCAAALACAATFAACEEGDGGTGTIGVLDVPGADGFVSADGEPEPDSALRETWDESPERDVPTHEPEPVPEPEPEPEPEPVPDSGPEPVPDSGPEPVPDSGPDPAPDLAPDPTHAPDSPPPSPAAFRVTTASIQQPSICFPGADPCMDVTSTADAWLTGAIAPTDLTTALLLRFSPLDPADPDAFLEVGAGACGWTTGECAFAPGQVPALFPGPLFPGLDPCEPGVPATCFVTERRDMDVWFGDLFLAFRDGHLAGTVAPGGAGITNGILDAMIPVNTAKSIQVSAGGAGTWKLSDFLTFAPVETLEGVKGYRFRIAYEAVEVGFAVP